MNRYRLRHVGRFVLCIYGAVFIWALATTIILGYQEGYHEEASKQRGEKQEISRQEGQHGSRQATQGNKGTTERQEAARNSGTTKPKNMAPGIQAAQRDARGTSTGAAGTKKREAPKTPTFRTTSHSSRGGGMANLYTSEVTGYTARDKGMDGRGITKTETKAKAGRTCAADLRVFPPGTVLDIEGIGVRVVEDIGGAIDNYDIDVFTDTKAEAYKIGRSKRKVRVISWGVR